MQTQQLQQRVVSKGIEQLSTADLLGLLMTPELAAICLAEYGGLKKLRQAGYQELSALPGMTTAHYCQLQAALSLAEREHEEVLRYGEQLSNAEQVKHYLIARLGYLPQECFCALFLDQHCQFLQFRELSRGTPNSSPVHIGELAKHALKLHAAAVIVVHNHPGGLLQPSETDLALTRQVKHALALIEVALLDHFIVVSNNTLSLREEGLLR